MADSSDRPNAVLRVRLDVQVSADDPQLLAGLEDWRERGLLSDRLLINLAAQQLCCPARLPQAATNPAATSLASASGQFISEAVPQRPQRRSRSVTPAVPSAPSRHPLTRALQGLMAELSVVWLLSLGVFLVVVSSAVLAATQWQTVSAAGQYLILLAYTGALWGGQLWARRQASLKLTATTLQVLTLLLIPVNTWAMDQLGLWASPAGIGAIALATPILGVITWSLYQRQLHASIADTLAFAGLSLLHWGWAIPDVPIMSVNVGAVAGILPWLLLWLRQLGWIGGRSPQVLTQSPSLADRPTAPSTPSLNLLNRVTLLGMYAFGVLLLRGLMWDSLANESLGLALGIWGWGLGQLVQITQAQRMQRLRDQPAIAAALPSPSPAAPLPTDVAPSPEPSSLPSQPAARSDIPPAPKLPTIRALGGFSGAVLLIAFGLAVQWETLAAIAVWGLGAHLVWQSLRRDRRRWDVWFLLNLGVVLHPLIWDILPRPIQMGIIDPLATVLGVEMDFSLFATLYLPYLGAIAGLTGWLQRQDQPKLARFGEWYGVGFGVLLGLFAVWEPWPWAIHLLASTLYLGVITQRRQAAALGVYCTQSLGLLAIAATFQASVAPDTVLLWAELTLMIAIVEAVLGQSRLPQAWQRSSRMMSGFVGAVSYGCFMQHSWQSLAQWTDLAPAWSLQWFFLPLTLVILTARAGATERSQWAQASVITSSLAPGLTLFDSTAQPWGFLLSAVLLGLTSIWLDTVWVATIAIGALLCTVASVLWQGGLAALPPWYLAGAIATLSLWGLSWGLQRGDRPGVSTVGPTLGQRYGQAAQQWSVVLTVVIAAVQGLELIIRYTDQAQLVTWPPSDRPEFSLLATGGLAIGWLGHYRRHLSPEVVLVAVGLGEILLAQGNLLRGGTGLELAVINSIAGVATLSLLYWGRSQPVLIPVPLAYASLGVIFRLTHFTAWTGWLTLVAAAVGVLVGWRLPSAGRSRGVKLAALLGISAGVYELVLYPMLQAQAGYPADGLILLAGIAALITLIYRLGRAGISRVLTLAIADLAWVTHAHWLLGLGLLALSALVASTDGVSFQPWGLLIGSGLALYALEQGRSPGQPDPAQGNTGATAAMLWTWAGLGLLLALGGYGRILYPNLRRLEPWLGAIASGVAILSYRAPWSRWGWAESPWRWSAMLLPLLAVGSSVLRIHPVSVAIAAGFYLWLSQDRRQFRWVYLTLILLTGLWWDQCWERGINSSMAYVIPVGSAILIGAQFDPALQPAERRGLRHGLKIAGLSLIFLTALLSPQWRGLPLGGLSLVSIVVGLALQTRAWLFVGTLFFGITVIDQFVVLNRVLPFLKWVLGIAVGSGLIWVAATFETRREQMVTLAQRWNDALDNWD